MKLFFIQFGAELRKMLARKRTFLGFGAFVVLEIMIYWVLQRDGISNGLRRLIARQGESFDNYFSPLTLGFIVLVFSVMFCSVFMTLVAGDVVAKESEDGNLRLVLARPISRLRLLTLKYLSCLTFTLVLMQFVFWTVLLMGILQRGWGGGMFIFPPFAPGDGVLVLFDAKEGLQRYALASGTLSLSMMCASSMGFFMSCFRIKPATATISALAYLFVDSILRESRLMENYNYLLVTHYMNVWRSVFLETIPWVHIVRSYVMLGGISLTLFVLGAVIFHNRDIKS
jgi:ABC-2 type transport system permease protein